MADPRVATNAAAVADGMDGEKEKKSFAADEGSASQGFGTQGAGIGSMFDRLEIGEDEFDDLVLEEDDAEILESTRWLAVARVHCPKTFSHEAFFHQMRNAWNSAREISIRPIGINRFVIQCFCLGDWEKVMDKGPWLFRDWPLIIAPYDGLSDPELVELEYMPVWIQVHKIPEGYRKEKMVKQLVSRSAGEIVTVEMNPSGGFRGDYVRVRVKHDVRRPLTRFVSVVLGGKRSLFAVKYEKIGQLCFACGLIGHEFKECGTGVFEEKDLKYGDWIHAFPNGRGRGYARGGLRGGNISTPSGIRGDLRHGRGRGVFGDLTGWERGNYVDWRDHPERINTAGDLEDTAASPIKDGDTNMTDLDKNAKKRLAFDQETLNQSGTLVVANNVMVTDQVLGEGEELDKCEETKDNKRHKRSNGTAISGTSTGSAASLEDDRQVQ
ncbi:hypothetical protein QYE76_005744 [Lolium multiflorum]|uniref:CCHC-type domain-containing protein n=1 Tax=Lolium multiflorum TaxID=4521 RepID=A0AAD8W2J1_LOLMU|nr:hypothetical protein QYE76_005744 [Lolium multiflorum]